MRVIIFICLLLAFSFLSKGINAQCSLHGTVTDNEDHTPVIGALVYFPDLKKGAVTDLQGKYVIDNLPKGKYLAEIKQLGYTVVSNLVDACVTPEQNFLLSASVVEAREVVVTGSSRATELLKMPGAVITVNREVLFKAASVNLIDALATQPGISQITTGAGISKPVIRGLGYNRIVTLNDGIRQEGQQWGDEHGIEIDEFSADKVEILKGPASLMYGSDAMAGVINILGATPPAEGVLGGSVITNYQSNNGLMGLSLMQNGNIKGITWMLRGSYKNAGNYQNKYDGRVFNSGFNESDFNGTLGINRKWGFSHFIFSSFNQKLGLIEGERDSLTGKFTRLTALQDTSFGYEIVNENGLKSRIPDIPKQSILHQKMAIDNNFMLGKSRLSLLLAYQHNSRKEFADILAPQTAGINFSLKTVTLDVKYFIPEKNNFQITLGGNALIQENKNLGEEVLIPEYMQKEAGVFGYFKKEINPRFNISGGLRFDYRNYNSTALQTGNTLRFEAMNKNYKNMSGSIGATYEINKLTVLKLNVSRGYRAPQAAELGSNGLHEGTFRYERGNSNLIPETSWQGDLGIIYNSSHFTFDAALFSNVISNFIYLKKLSSVLGGDSISTPFNPVPTFQFVQGNAVLNGAEMSVDIHPHPLDWLHFENTFSFVNAINKNQPDSGKYLPFTPPMRISSELRADLKKVNSTLVNFYVLVNARIYFAQNHVMLLHNTETPTPGYTLFNAAFGSDIKNKKGKKICSLIIVANNITNIAYQSHLSRLKYAPENYATGRTGVYDMGRNVSMKLLVPLSFKK